MNIYEEAFLAKIVNEKNFIVDVRLDSKYGSEYTVIHRVKSVRIRSYSGPFFPAFGMNTEKYSVSRRIQSECEK